MDLNLSFLKLLMSDSDCSSLRYSKQIALTGCLFVCLLACFCFVLGCLRLFYVWALLFLFCCCCLRSWSSRKLTYRPVFLADLLGLLKYISLNNTIV